MKKILLLSITSLALLMADFTLTGKQLTPVSEPAEETTPPVVESTPPPETTAPVNTSGIIPNSVDLIWADTYAGNTHFTTATNKSQGQYDSGDPYTPPFKIGTPSYRVPTANMWIEVELEGTDTSCSQTINQATNTRVEIAGYKGWWKGDDGVWHDMKYTSRGGNIAPNPNDLVGGFRGCEQQVFKDVRETGRETIRETIVRPGHASDVSWPAEQHLTIKPENYYRWHGWGGKTIFPTETTVKAIVWQIYMRLVVEDASKPDDRHLARYVAHTGTDRKEYNGTQMWNIEISRFKRITNDWQPFNLCNGIMTKEELEANPPPFSSVP